MQYTVLNTTRQQRTLNLPSRKGGVYLAPRARALLTEDEVNSPDVKALLRGGYLRIVQGGE